MCRAGPHRVPALKASAACCAGPLRVPALKAKHRVLRWDLTEFPALQGKHLACCAGPHRVPALKASTACCAGTSPSSCPQGKHRVLRWDLTEFLPSRQAPRAALDLTEFLPSRQAPRAALGPHRVPASKASTACCAGPHRVPALKASTACCAGTSPSSCPQGKHRVLRWDLTEFLPSRQAPRAALDLTEFLPSRQAPRAALGPHRVPALKASTACFPERPGVPSGRCASGRNLTNCLIGDLCTTPEKPVFGLGEACLFCVLT